MATTFTDAARTTLLGLDITDIAREALVNGKYNAWRNTWLFDLDASTELEMIRLLREENAKQGDDDSDRCTAV